MWQPSAAKQKKTPFFTFVDPNDGRRKSLLSDHYPQQFGSQVISWNLAQPSSARVVEQIAYRLANMMAHPKAKINAVCLQELPPQQFSTLKQQVSEFLKQLGRDDLAKQLNGFFRQRIPNQFSQAILFCGQSCRQQNPKLFKKITALNNEYHGQAITAAFYDANTQQLNILTSLHMHYVPQQSTRKVPANKLCIDITLLTQELRLIAKKQSIDITVVGDTNCTDVSKRLGKANNTLAGSICHAHAQSNIVTVDAAKQRFRYNNVDAGFIVFSDPTRRVQHKLLRREKSNCPIITKPLGELAQNLQEISQCHETPQIYIDRKQCSHSLTLTFKSTKNAVIFSKFYQLKLPSNFKGKRNCLQQGKYVKLSAGAYLHLQEYCARHFTSKQIANVSQTMRKAR